MAEDGDAVSSKGAKDLLGRRIGPTPAPRNRPGGRTSESEAGAAPGEPSSDQRDDLNTSALSEIERNGPLVLLLTAIAAWVLAWINAEQEAVATTWAASGFALALAAAFFSRVRKISKDGVEVDPMDLAIKLGKPQEGDLPEEAVARVATTFDAIRSAELHRPRSDSAAANRWPASPRQVAMEQDRVENNLAAAVFNLLHGKGFEVTRESGDQVRSDLLATKGDTVINFEVRPFIESLGSSEAAAITARHSPIQAANAHFALVLRTGVSVAPEASARLVKARTSVVWADPDDISSVRIVVDAGLPADLAG